MIRKKKIKNLYFGIIDNVQGGYIGGKISPKILYFKDVKDETGFKMELTSVLEGIYENILKFIEKIYEKGKIEDKEVLVHDKVAMESLAQLLKEIDITEDVLIIIEGNLPLNEILVYKTPMDIIRNGKKIRINVQVYLIPNKNIRKGVYAVGISAGDLHDKDTVSDIVLSFRKGVKRYVSLYQLLKKAGYTPENIDEVSGSLIGLNLVQEGIPIDEVFKRYNIIEKDSQDNVLIDLGRLVSGSMFPLSSVTYDIVTEIITKDAYDIENGHLLSKVIWILQKRLRKLKEKGKAKNKKTENKKESS